MTNFRTRPDLYDFLGSTPDQQAHTIAHKLIPDSTVDAASHRQKRLRIFRYIVDFLHTSTFEADLLAPIGKGINLAPHPFLAPTGLIAESFQPDGNVIATIHLLKDRPDLAGKFRFQEQYRWDTYFQNKLLALIGGEQIAIYQLMNLVDVFKRYQRIPNALTTEFLSHPHPPFEALAAFDLQHHASATHGDWFDQVMHTVEADLAIEWWDYGTSRIHPRQDADFVQRYGRYLSRYVSIHFHPLMVGCQDGKDHHWISAYYGEHYLSVQLNCLIWASVDALQRYYQGRDAQKAAHYHHIRQQLGDQIQALMWVDDATQFPKSIADPQRYRGFRNHDMRQSVPIAYGDLSAEIFPLFVGLASLEQAQITLDNLQHYYLGNIGLASTSKTLRQGGAIAHKPLGWSDDPDPHADSGEFQWELNSWPPLMMVAVDGLLRYADQDRRFYDLALQLQKQWVRYLEHTFTHSTPAIFHEKAPYDSSIPVGEGFYGNLPGFGWTLASYAVFLHRLALENQLD